MCCSPSYAGPLPSRSRGTPAQVRPTSSWSSLWLPQTIMAAGGGEEAGPGLGQGGQAGAADEPHAA